MEGVEILNQFEAVTEYGFNFGAFGASLIIMVIAGAFVSVIMALDGDDWFLAICGIVISVICALVISVFIAGLKPIPTKYETHYQVTVTDAAKMTEFNERYEILDQEGDIYTVREK